MFSTRLILFFTISVIFTQSTQCSWNEEWIAYKTKYNLTFKSVQNDLINLKAYKANRIFIENYNKDTKSLFKLKINGKMHLSVNEFKNRYLLKSNVTKKIKVKLTQLSSTVKKNPKPIDGLKVNRLAEIDWVKQGMVTPVRDQKSCGCCYAFSTVTK